jgi:hypothetical protein
MKELIVKIEGVTKPLRMTIDPTLSGWYADADKTTCQNYPLAYGDDYGCKLYTFEVVGITFLQG